MRYYYAASIAPRYGDTIATYVCLMPGKVAMIAALAADHLESEYLSCLDLEDGEDVPEVCVYGESRFVGAAGLISPGELMEHRRDLLAGKVVVL